MVTRTRTIWNTDGEGYFTRQLGWKRSRSGTLVQHKFRLGKELKEAKRRDQKLQEFWEQIEATKQGARAEWNEETLAIARHIAWGTSPMPIAKSPQETEAGYVRRVHETQKMYTMASFVAEDQQAFAEGTAGLRQFATLLRQSLNELNQAEEVLFQKSYGCVLGPAPIGGPMLHDAMEQYSEWLDQEFFQPALGHISANGHTRKRQVGILLGRHRNVPLGQLDLETVESMFQYWRKRPLKKGTKKPISRKSATNLLGELTRFFDWLHRSSKFDWKRPEGYADLACQVEADPVEMQQRLEQVDTFSFDELVLLNKYATPLERVFLLLGLNCAFGTAEIASLLQSEVFLRQAHEKRHQEILNYPTTSADSFIKRVRRKNGVYGEFILFPQTVEAIEWVVEQRKKRRNPADDPRLLLNEKGEPYDKPTESGNRNQQIPNRFADLLRRIAADKNTITPLSFGKLRKTANNLMRQLCDGEIMGVFACHGQAVKTDNLADVYSNRPFGKVFAGIRKLQDYLQPVFDAAGPSPFSSPPQAYTSRKTIERMVQARSDGLTVAQIAAETGKDVSTVFRHLARARRAAK